MIDRLLRINLLLFFFLLPLFMLPITGLSSEMDKQTLLIFFSLFALFLLLLKWLIKKSITFVRTPMDLPVIALSLVFVFSTLLFSPNKPESLSAPMATGTIIALTFLFFTITQTFNHEKKNGVIYPLLLSSLVISALYLASQVQIFPNILPVGSLISTFSFLLAIFILGLVNIIATYPSLKSVKTSIKLKSLGIKTTALLLTSAGIILSAFHLATDQKPIFLPFTLGWSIMMEIFKAVPNFLLGVGPANYQNAYTIGKPLAVNITPYWNIISNTSSNYILTLSSEVGFISLLIFFYLIYKIVKFNQHSSYQSISLPYLVSLITLLVLHFLIPTNLVIFSLFIILLALSSPKWSLKKIKLPSLANWVVFLVAAGIILTLYLQGKIYLSNIYYRKALFSSDSQQAVKSLNQVQQAINLYPYSENYYRLASDLSLGIARSLSQDNQATQSAQQVAFFSQQAINSATRMTDLNPKSSQNWAQLAKIYQALIGTTPGIEEHAIASLQRQIALDPNSPQPKVKLGGLFLSLNRYNQANLLFNQAIAVKPDWNSSHYNLAYLLIQIGNINGAVSEMQKTLVLTPLNSPDYQKVQGELERLKSLLPQEATPSSDVKDSSSETSSTRR